MSCKEIEINGQKYVRADLANAKSTDGLDYVIVRCVGAGVHAGYLLKRDDKNKVVELVKARRLWQWWGKTLTGLGLEGTTNPEKCKFADPIGTSNAPHVVASFCEIIPCTEKARLSIEGVKGWKND